MGAAEVLVSVLRSDIERIFLCSKEDVSHWAHAVRLSAWVHDWGKANDNFQEMLQHGVEQGVRHELITWAVMDELDDWLVPCFQASPRWVKAAVYYAAAGHHLKYPDPIDRPGVEACAFMAHPTFKKLLELGKPYVTPETTPPLRDRTYTLGVRGSLAKIEKALKNTLDAYYTPMDMDMEKRLIAAVKATLMAADLSGSALPRGGMSVDAWVRGRLEKSLAADSLETLVATRLRGKTPHPFQEQVRDSAAHTLLVEAGCGTGKTAAAYLWASRKAHGRRLFFCYPTTATASEGFAGYLHDPDFDALLVHGRAEVDYELLENLPDRGQEQRDLRSLRMEALDTWPSPAVVCTAHTVLGIMENTHRGLYAWPSMARAVFVFDEVHAFSDTLFSYLLRFMQELPGVPVLLMTATLPKAKRDALQRVAEGRGTWEVIGGPRERECAFRYRILQATAEQAWKQAGAVIDAGGKVLWVCNTVNRAMRAMQKAVELGINVEPFHSRYRYKDRLCRQRMVIDGFLPGAPAFLAITTQVAEMSLDLSADLLITERAPVPAMIQRMGRLNRFCEVPTGTACALVTEPENDLPYSTEEMRGTGQWLDQVADGNPKSQSDLARAFVGCCSGTAQTPQPAPRCEWIDGLWQSAIRRPIEDSSPSVEVVREEDAGLARPVEYAIPMPIPRNKGYHDWARAGRFLVAPAGSLQYDERIGAQWKR
jgi:CRISPR-associated endonuclease/helicase Cas3